MPQPHLLAPSSSPQRRSPSRFASPCPELTSLRPPRPGLGVALWLHCDAVQELHDSLEASGTAILADPAPSPFGLTFAFADPDGYAVTVHEKES